jgi:DNA repair protein endonuclease SAE2/CtIP C-terminus
MIEIAGMPATHGNDKLTDESVLRDYLGEGYSSKQVNKMEKAEKKEMLMKSRVKALADEHGVHRTAFERRTTLLGFWRADMPSSPEEAEDRAKTKAATRLKVEERHVEALKGGRYLL